MLRCLHPGGSSHQLAALFDRAAPGASVCIGRQTESTLCLLEAPPGCAAAYRCSVSRRHACLEVRDGQLQVRDEGTVNGTYVNQCRVQPGAWTVLQAGDVVAFGG
jgi:pSer/pThr/pTyr-binding forkhead associated (FHA) protein